MVCDHKWKKHPEFDCLVCPCGAIAEDTSAKDPFKQGETYILKPSREEWETLSKPERHRWFEANKERILTDVRKYGYSKAKRKWDICAATWSLTMKRWGIKLVGATRPLYQPEEEVTKGSSKFPEFSNDWPEAVQLKWLEIYEKKTAN